LLSLNLLLLLSAVVTCCYYYLSGKLLWPLIITEPTKKRGRPKKDAKPVSYIPVMHRIYKPKRLLWLIAVSVVCAILLQFLISHETDSSLPSDFSLMVLPATLSAGFLGIAIMRSIHNWGIAAFCLALSLLLSLLLINNFYRFYPTLGEVFNRNGVASLNEHQNKVQVRSSGSTKTPASLNRASVEGSVDAVVNEPTAGKVYSVNIPGTTSHFNARTAYVYLPAVYTTDPNIRLPVIVLMPGFPGLPENWLGSGLQATMDNFAKSHDGITPIIFMVDNTGSVTNDTECVNSPRGNVETYLTDDVPTYIKSHFDVQQSSAHWAIGGLSLGGTCGIMLALRHPNVYDNFIDLGGEIGPEVGPKQQTIDTLFGGSEADWQAHQPEYLLANNSYKGMNGFFGDGKQDTPDITQAATELNLDAQKAGIHTVYDTINGEHTFNVWQETFKLALPWMSNALGATECRTSCI
jgi:S-formylglutathione hydrolase FrmB